MHAGIFRDDSGSGSPLSGNTTPNATVPTGTKTGAFIPVKAKASAGISGRSVNNVSDQHYATGSISRGRIFFVNLIFSYL